MLAPYGTRASLDIVIHHPWLANYRHRLLDYHKQYCHDQMEDLNKRSITTNHEGDITVNQESLENEQCRTKPPSLICNSASKRTVLSHKKSIKRFNSVGTTSTVMLHQHIVTATPNYHERTSPHSNSKTYRSLHQHKGRRGISFKKAFTFVFQGPFPPPKRPYQDLSHLGTRKSVFLNCRA
ncbi:hypothetical protein BDF20DRAFT_859365 [Mycotypha africana]|uniref:uncharacterized protein n=1 Tax=Mycotypha africana TaxID=64632 RepID=UPI0023003B65|nr:uncharacterized protein BDF20DRAFT_859365 [Mycotypha africana]KAI8984339.1 hypothetical protein BDF20DRAFT_859365 [Mycotypha africana]